MRHEKHGRTAARILRAELVLVMLVLAFLMVGCGDTTSTGAAQTALLTCNPFCLPPEICYNGSCINTTNDPQNCGIPGNQCAAGDSCCDSACVDTQTSDAHCGACGQSVLPGFTCSNGISCQDSPSIEACSVQGVYACVNINDNPQHCGACGNACTSTSICKQGACQSCAKTVCANKCVDLNSNNANCGQCGNNCGANATCTGGICVTAISLCVEAKIASKVSYIAKTKNSNKQGDLDEISDPSHNISFLLMQTYNKHDALEDHAYSARADIDGKNYCYYVFRGSSWALVLEMAASSPVGISCRSALRDENGSYTPLAGCMSSIGELYHSAFIRGIVEDLVFQVERGNCDGGLRLIGHSRGGAVASLLAAELYGRAPAQYSKSYMKVFTFGEPRVIENTRANSFHEYINKIRFYNKNDSVPDFATGDAFGYVYRHYGQAIKIKDGGDRYEFKGQNSAPDNALNENAHVIATYKSRINRCTNSTLFYP